MSDRKHIAVPQATHTALQEKRKELIESREIAVDATWADALDYLVAFHTDRRGYVDRQPSAQCVPGDQPRT